MSASYPPSAPLQFSNTAQRVLVTGATGFIGQGLVRALLADGHEVTALTRRPALVDELFSGKVSSITAMETLPADARFDAIVNLAGARILGWRWTEARKKILRASRIGLTNSVVDWIARAQHKPRMLLSASAIGYYGIQAQDDATDLVETGAPQPIFMSQLCLQWEAAAARASEFGVVVNIMRFGVVFGHDGALPMMLLPIKLGMGGTLGSGKQQLSWIHIEDLLRAIAHLYQNAVNATGAQQALINLYNFTAPEVISQREFARVASTILHRPCVVPTPAFVMRWLLGEQADLLLEGQRVIPHNLRNSGFSFEFPTVSSALTDLCK